MSYVPLANAMCVVDALHPLSQTNATVNGAAVDMLFFHRLLYIVDIGVMSGSCTVDFKLQGAVASTFGTPIDIPGKGVTQLLQAGGNNRILKVGCTAEDLVTLTNAVPAARYVRCVLTVGTAATLASYVALASEGKYKPEVAASGKEIVAVVQTIADAS